MKTIRCPNDLKPYGFDCLTGEACGLTYRLLYDLNAKAKKTVEKCFGIALTSEAWNSGPTDDPHVASIMLSPETLLPLGVFCLLDDRCRKVFLYEDKIVGIEHRDDEEEIRKLCGDPRRILSYGGTAGDRNVHEMSQRVV
ncbi:MAG TPA: hypothetical protein VGN57_19110 [Pirellulaceae bacterium]|jgi:hypothetical protein|nr:hypothetical protein [Pirellulaceae bacterium]